jgi:hypothetical protein
MLLALNDACFHLLPTDTMVELMVPQQAKLQLFVTYKIIQLEKYLSLNMA